jgi:hypothetical protein
MDLFRINEYQVESELDLPCAVIPPSSAPVPAGDRLVVRRASRPLDEFPRVCWLGRRAGTSLRSYDVGDGVLVCLADCLRIHVDARGSRVTLAFDPEDDWAAGYARACTINLAVCLCTLLRGGLPLHAAGARVGGKSVGLMARSGTGKSTLLWALVDGGDRFAVDDVLPVRVEDGRVMAAPSGGLHAKLSRQALEERGMEAIRYEPMLPDREEFWVPIPPEHRAVDTGPLDALYLLRPGDDPALWGSVRVRRLAAGAALGALMENTQALWAVFPLLDGGQMLRLYDAVIDSVPIYALEYCRRREVLPELVRVIRELTTATGSSAERARTGLRRLARRSPARPGRWALPWRRAAQA